MRKTSRLLTLVVLTTCKPVFCYELGTHARITLNAFQQCSLTTDPTKLPNLGLPSLRFTELGDFYYDVSGGAARRRETFPFDFDRAKFPDTSLIYQAGGWIMRGAVREDDGSPAATWLQALLGELAPLDATPNINRFCNHFFDPLHATSGATGGLTPGLTDVAAILGCGVSSRPAIQWASGAYDPLVAPPGILEELGRANHFTLFDAREAMWRALTGYEKALTTKVASSGMERKAYWATTFRALGDILHLNQDMAQPQHTRNEAHPNSYYETNIELRARRAVLWRWTDSGKVTFTLPDLTYTGYTIPRFSSWTSYWTTGIGPASRLSGRGLADYSSRGFFTPGRFWGDTTYPSPSSDPADYTPQTILQGGWNKEYLTAGVPDFYAGVPTTARALRRSVWSALGGISVQNALDENVFDDDAALLIPRAVGYSAGLLDYFFNGRLAISLPDEGAYAVVDHSAGGGMQGFTQVLLKVTNTTPPLTEGGTPYPQNMIGGTAVAVVKFHKNTCYKPDLTGEYAADFNKIQTCRENTTANALDRDDTSESIVVSKSQPLWLDAGATKALKFDFSGDPIPLGSSDLYLQVVYRGPLGTDAGSAEQDVVVVGTKDISEPTFFSYFNASDYSVIAGKVYTRDRIAGDQELLAQVRPVQCVTGTPPNLHLVDGCLVPFKLSMKFGFADLSDPTVQVDDLPSPGYMRFAFLTDGAAAPSALTGGRRAAVSLPRLKMSVTAGGRQPMVLLNQQSVCYPLDPFDITPGQNQLYFDSLIYDTSATAKLRGITGYFQVSCVNNGDGSAPGSPDDRDTAMADIDKSGSEGQPFPLTIKSTFISP